MSVLKKSIVEAIVTSLREMIATARQNRKDALGELNDHKSFAEQQRGDNAEGARHLAVVHEVRINELEGNIATLLRAFERSNDHGRMFSIVDVSDPNGKSTSYFIVPVGGGIPVRVEGRSYVSINSAAPFARALIDSEIGDEVVISDGKCRRSATVTRIF